MQTHREPIWDVKVCRTLQQGESRFELQATFKSAARRVVLFGPSGSGKTLTLKMIAGIATPQTGRIRVLGQPVFDTAQGINVPPQQRQLAYMFQDYALFPHLTVRQNIAFALHRGGFNPSQRASVPEADRWIETFGLQAVAQHLPHQISGGQRQRTALARALCSKPRALLLDEPFAALDRGLRQHLREELLALHTRLDIPMLVITHDDEDVSALAQEVICLREGRVTGTGDSGAGASGSSAALNPVASVAPRNAVFMGHS